MAKKHVSGVSLNEDTIGLNLTDEEIHERGLIFYTCKADSRLVKFFAAIIST